MRASRALNAESPIAPPPSPPPSPREGGSLREDCGLVAPCPSPWAWPPDVHLVVAIVAAVPVWLALGIFAGERLRVPASAFAWVSLVLIQPLLEELVLRGVLQGQLLRLTRRRRLGPVSVANVVTTAVFVALHVPTQHLGWALAVAPPSLVFGHLRERFASVWPAVAMHGLYNAGLGLTAWLARY